MTTLLETLAVVTSALRVDQVMNLALSQLQLVLAYNSAAIWQHQPAEDVWRLAASRRARGPAGETVPSEAWALPAPLAAELAATRGPILVPDLSADSRFGGNGARPAVAWLAVPLVNQGDVHTILVLQKAQPAAYRDSQAALVQTFAHQAALALDNAQRYEDSLQRAQDIERRGALLVRAASLFGGALELPSLLALTARLLAEALDADRGAALVLPAAGTADDPSAPGRPLAWAAYPPGPADSPAPDLRGDGLIEQLADARRPLAMPDWAAQPGARPAAWLGADLQSAAFFPLMSGERQVGLVGLGFTTRRTFPPADLELGQQLAAQAAAAVTSAVLYTDLQVRLAEQTTIDQAIRAISRAGDLPQLVETVGARLPGWLPADSFYLALFDAERNTAALPLWVEAGQPQSQPAFTPAGVLRHVLQTRRPVRLAGDIAAQTRELGIPLAAGADRPVRFAADGDRLAAAALLAVPITFGDQALGVLAVEARHPLLRAPRAHPVRRRRPTGRHAR